MEKFVNHIKKGYEENIRGIIIAFLISTFGSYVFWGNEIINPDTLLIGLPYNIGAWEIQIGRYGWAFFRFFDHGLASSYFSSFIAIFVFLLAAICIIDLFKIKNELIKIVIMVLVSSSPYSINMLTYPYVSIANATGVFFAVFAIWVWNYFHCNKIGAVIGAVCLAFSISIYQSNIGITAIVGTMVLIQKIFDDEQFVEKTLNLAALVLLGGIFYYIGLKISLIIYDLELNDYKGANQFSVINIIKNLSTSIPKCYEDFFSFYFERSFRMSNSFGTSVIYIILGLVSILSIIKAMLDRKLKKVRVIMIAILLILSPVLCNVINIIIPGTEVGILLVMPMTSFIVMLFALSYDLSRDNINCNRCLRAMLAMLMCILSINYIFVNNVDGLEYKRQEDSVLYLANRVYSKLEDRGVLTDPNLKVGIFGNPFDGNYRWEDPMFPYMNEHMKVGFLYKNSYSESYRGWPPLFIRYFGDTGIHWCTQEDLNDIIKTEEFKDAPAYPAEGSIFKIGDIIVVKMANYVEN